MELVWKYGRLSSIPFLNLPFHSILASTIFHTEIFVPLHFIFHSIPYHALLLTSSIYFGIRHEFGLRLEFLAKTFLFYSAKMVAARWNLVRAECGPLVQKIADPWARTSWFLRCAAPCQFANSKLLKLTRNFTKSFFKNRSSFATETLVNWTLVIRHKTIY